jgi:hypothetical protein
MVGEIISEWVGGFIPERRAASAGIGTGVFQGGTAEQEAFPVVREDGYRDVAASHRRGALHVTASTTFLVSAGQAPYT